VLIAVILVVTGALLAAYLLISDQDKPGGKSTNVERSSDLAQRTNENDLRTTAKELSGDVGILNDLTGAYTKTSIIAMVIFSVIGLGYLTYGKKSQQFLMLICGLALMGYSYFVDGIVYIILIGVGLIALPFILGRK
jgi:L-cystine uptake protein TcyP (sodium:dicarboxylate symporter family)